MKLYIKLVVLLLGCTIKLQAQELFVFTEPASNMPARSLGLRLNNWVMEENFKGNYNYQFIPEIMWGVNKNLMIHLEGFYSNYPGYFKPQGLGAYAKYRLYTSDQVYRHFRLAAFTRLSTNNNPIMQEEIETFGFNSGYQVGIIGTQLLHKTALSSTLYYQQAFNNGQHNEFPATYSNDAVNYTFSAGRLILPKKYIGFKQTNVNLMVELLGQTLLENGKSYLDVAPAVQFIFNSQTRIDIGYKRELYSNMQRVLPNGFLVRIEHVLFNVI